MQIKNKVFCAVLFAAAACAPPLNATEIVTTSYSAWVATQTGTPTEWNFSFPNGGSYSTAAGYTLSVGTYGPINVTGPDGSGYTLTEDTSYRVSGRSYQTLQGASDGVGSMVFTTPAAGLTAFGLGLGEIGTASPITVTLSDGETFTASPAVNGTVYLGLSSQTAITSFTLQTSSGANIELTDFFAGVSNESASAPAPAAEVTTAIMIGTGLLLFGARRRVFSNLSRSKVVRENLA